jgi:hypothetical protein
MKILSIIAILVISFLLTAGCLSFSKQKSDFKQDSQGKTIVREFATPIEERIIL